MKNVLDIIFRYRFLCLKSKLYHNIALIFIIDVRSLMIQAQKMSDSSYNFKKLSAKLPIVHASTLSGKLYAIRVRVFREQNKIIENIFRSKLEAQIESKEKPFY